jgi:hypothetical protein
MSEVYQNLHVGGMELCSFDEGVACLHAAKDPCHRIAVGYFKGNLPPSAPEYLTARRGASLALNIVDAPVPIFRKEVFDAALDFIDEMLPKGRVYVHCNGGFSRSPSIAMLWLAKRAKTIPDGSFGEAQQAFTAFYPTYAPGKGIETYLSSNWGAFR